MVKTFVGSRNNSINKPAFLQGGCLPIDLFPRIFATSFMGSSNFPEMIRGAVLIALIFCFGHTFGQKAAGPAKPAVLFSIANTPYYTDEFVYLYKKNYASKPGEFTEEKISEYLNLFINFKLKVTEARQRGMDTTAAFRKEFGSYKEELRKPYAAEPDELDRLAREAYEHLMEELHVAHILIMVRPDATPADTLAAFEKISGLRNRVLAGEDFGKLAAEFSEDPGARGSQGDLGYFTGFQFVYPFEQVAFQTKVGEISRPVRTRFGYHIIKVIDRQPAHGEVEVSHIYINSRNGNEAKAKNTIFQVYDQLKAGRNWDEVCSEYSEDGATKGSGGRLKPFGIRGMDVPEFEKVAFSLKNAGDISDPFHSALGWHLVRLEKKIPVPPFKEMEAALKRKVARDERLQISKTAALNRRKKELGFADGDGKSAVMLLADSSLVRGKWKFHGDPAVKGKNLFTIQGKPVSAAEFIRFVETNQTASSLTPTACMEQLYNSFVDEKLTAQQDVLLEQQHPEFGRLLNEYREGILLFSIMEKEVWNRASEDTLGQRKFYEQDPARYKAGDRVDARIFSTGNKAFLDEVKGRVQKGDTLTVSDLKKFKTVQNFRSYEKGESKVVDQVSWFVGLHETEADGMYYLVEIRNLIPPGNKSFQEARAQVISDYQDNLEKTWVNQLKSKYPVKINAKGKKQAITELNRQ